MAANAFDVVQWLHTNVGEFYTRSFKETRVTHYYGEGWEARWRQFGSGWFMDVTFDDPKHAAFFTLRWK